MLDNDSSCLTASFNSEGPHGDAYALVNSVARYAQDACDLFGREVLTNQQQAIDLALRQPVSAETVGRRHLDAPFEIAQRAMLVFVS
jgi:hypothetical protein